MSETLVSINYQNISNRRIAAYPITYGVPLPEGKLREATRLGILLPNGEIRSIQAEALETWLDGSLKWLLLDFALPLVANERGTVALVQGVEPVETPGFGVQETVDALTVTTKSLAVRFSKTVFSLFDSYLADNREMMAQGSDIVVEDLDGKRFYASLSKSLDVRIIAQGTQRITVQVSGRHTSEDGAEMLSFRLRYTFRPEAPGVDVAYKFTNQEAPETGVKLASIQLVIPTRLGRTTTKTIRQMNHGEDWYSRQVEIQENVEVLSGLTLHDPAKNHLGFLTPGLVLLRNFTSLRENLADYPYYLRPGDVRTDTGGGLRAIYPYLAVNGDDASLVGWFYDMTSNYPKSLRCDRHLFSFDIWPTFAGEMHVRRGQSKEHELYVSFAGRRRTPEEMEGIYFDHEIVGMGVKGSKARPATLSLDPQYVRDCQVLQLHRWLPLDKRRYTIIEAKMVSSEPYQSAIAPARGMWDSGDLTTTPPTWCLNNENDVILDHLREYYRQADPSRLVTALSMAYHNAHVDFIAFDPNPLRQGTMPAHCPAHTDGATYPSHMWVEGLFAAYNVTGNTDFLEAALSVGENMLHWQYTGTNVFYADSRECGWPMLAYLRLHEYTGEQKWLDACEEVFQFYKKRMDPDGMIRYELPHGVGTVVAGYGEFIGWRSLFFYYERTGRQDVKDFLFSCLEQVYLREPAPLIGWACNDLFPAWAAYALTGEDKYIEDNYPFLQFLIDNPGVFPWGGMDLHYYLAELHRRGILDAFCRQPGRVKG